MARCEYCKDEGCKYCRPGQYDAAYKVLHDSSKSKAEKVKRGSALTQRDKVISLVDRKPPSDPLASFYGTIRDAARLTENITLAERIAVLDVVRAELVRDFQAKIDGAEGL